MSSPGDPFRTPFRFCREILDAKGGSFQALQYMAAALDLKPLLDDWVPKERLPNFVAACRRYGLRVAADVQFRTVALGAIPDGVVGKAGLTTTTAYAVPLEADPVGSTHVYVSRHRSLLREGMWYPLIVRGRVVAQPYADTLRYGDVLGYPGCCVRFFRLKNNWFATSYLYEAFRNTDGTPHIYCNPLLKDAGPSYIYHMPCSYRCPATRSWVRKLRARLSRLEPRLVEAVDGALQGPFLVLYERDVIGFRGRLEGRRAPRWGPNPSGRRMGRTASRARYEDVFRVHPAPETDALLPALKAAGEVEVRGRELRLFRGGRLLRRIPVPLTDFAPRLMFLIRFSNDSPA